MRLTNDQVRELRSRYETEPDGAGDGEVVQACDDLIESRAETAAARAMLKSHEQAATGSARVFDPISQQERDVVVFVCPECGRNLHYHGGHAEGCAWAAAMGTER